MTTVETLLDSVRERKQTALSRLGSSRSLYAETGGDIETEPVLRAAADAEFAAWRTFSAWADDESDELSSDAFATTAAEEEGHFETVRELLNDEDELDGEYQPDAIPALHTYLRETEGTVERAGALLGRILASKRSKDQVVGYFVGDADPQTAAVFREFGEDLDSQLTRTTELLEAVCEDDSDWERAEDAAIGAIDAAYDEYVGSLESMGVNPKPVC